MNATRRLAGGVGNVYLSAIAIAAVCCITATFAVTNLALDPETKMVSFSLIVGAFLVCYFGLRAIQLRAGRTETAAEQNAIAENALTRLEEAVVFARSVKVGDTFRLIASHVRDILPAGTIALYLFDKKQARLELADADGADPPALAPPSAEACLADRTVNIAGNVVAIPLLNGAEPFGVIQMRSTAGWLPSDRSTFDAIATRVAPLILTSMAYESTVNNALIDAITELPNERALYLILENQIAESQRKLGERPLTLLAMDIRGFDDVNRRFGHVAGDRMLTFVAGAIRDNLRQMDFLARCNDDEFFAVLPTASKRVANEIIARITTALFGQKFRIAGSDPVEAELNFGWAAFEDDGDTVGQLIAAARLRKSQNKSVDNGKVLWFARGMTG